MVQGNLKNISIVVILCMMNTVNKFLYCENKFKKFLKVLTCVSCRPDIFTSMTLPPKNRYIQAEFSIVESVFLRKCEAERLYTCANG